MNNPLFISPENVPVLPDCILATHCKLLLSKEHETEASIYPENDTIIIKLKRPENESYDEVKITSTLFNSKEAKTSTPKFIFEKSSQNLRKYDYLNDSSEDSSLVLNINQVLYLIIHHRLSSFKQYNLQFTALLQQDVNNLTQYIEYQLPVSYNAKQKVLNTYVIFPASSHQGLSVPFGQKLGIKPTEEEWHPILSDLYPNLHFTSDGSMHKKGKLVLSKTPVYRSVGYGHCPNNTFKTLFEPKQNLPARLKTHVLGDAKELVHPDMSNIQQDCLVEKMSDGSYILKSKDNTCKKAVVVFASMEKDTKRFIAGEAEVSENIADTLVYDTSKVNLTFTSKTGITILHNIGEEIKVKHKEQVLLGYDVDFLPVYLPSDVLVYKVTKIINSGTAGLSTLYFESVIKAGNARITSNTGIKCVSKVMSDLGTIYIPKHNEKLSENLPKSFSPSVNLYLNSIDENELKDYLKVDSTELEDTTFQIKPDLILGMNAVKANTATHCNTIAIAQACLAVELGYYSPKLKVGFPNLLNSLDENEINEARLSLPEFFYVDRYGKKQKVIIGLAFLNFTELGSVYTDVKKQSFAFNSGKNIKDACPELSEHIFTNYLEEDKNQIALELYKVLNDTRGHLSKEDGLPKYSPKFIREKGLFTYDDLLIRRTNVTNGRNSKLLDPEFNKGFYIDFTKYSKGMIRIPSANLLNFFINQLPDGTYSFSPLIINISKIISNIIGNEQYPNMNINFIFNKDSKVKKMTSSSLYFTSVKGILYSSEETSMKLVQSLIKPKILGIGMKQVVDHLIPKDVVVITDYRKYKKLMSVYKEQSEIQDIFHKLQLNLKEDYDPFVEDLFSSLVEESSSKELIEEILNDVPRSLAIRNPSLWYLQCQSVRLWSLDHFALYLSRLPIPIQLDEYLSPRHNRDIVLINTFLCLIQKSDCDGDIMPLFVLNSDGQKILKDFKLQNVVQDEINWINKYIKKEYGTNDKLLLDTPEKHVYKLYTCSNTYNVKGITNTYPHFLFNAQLAKGNIGPATIDIWALDTIFQVYMEYCRLHDYKHVINGKVVGTITQVLTEEDRRYLAFKHIELVQGNVIEAVKHAEGGSAAFSKYFLDGMTKDTQVKIVLKELTDSYEKGGYNMPSNKANLLLYIVKWAQDVNLLKAVKNFITKYNKGNFPAKPEALEQWEEFIQANSYFGGLIQPLFDIKQNVDKKAKESKERALKLIKESEEISNDFSDLF